MNDAVILIVDDDPSILTVMNKSLSGHYRVLAANSGERALELAHADPCPDLVLLDVLMPGMNGYDVLAKLKEDPATSGIPVIFITSMDSAENEETGLGLGAVDYITKPINPAILEARVKTQLTLKRASDFLQDKNAYLESEVNRRVEEERVIMGVAIENYSERQRLLIENRRLLKQSMTIQEEERKNLARELHDEFGQALAGIRMDVDFIRASIKDVDSEEMAAAEDIQTILDDAASRMQEMMERLRPMTIDYMGLEDALWEMVDKWKHRHHAIECSLIISDDLYNLSDTLGLAVYRIIQESLTNIVRHSQADHVDIKIDQTDDKVQLTIADNGQGMDKSQTVTGLGHIGMRERVQALGGTFDIESAPGEGVTIVAELPLVETDHKEELNE